MLALALATAIAPSIHLLDWMQGSWRTEVRIAKDGARWTEELWTEPAFGTLLGVGRSIGGLRTRSFDFMRIAQDNKGIAFFGAPNGAPAVRFPLVSFGTLRLEFANPNHDYPQRIVYQRRGNTLTATISLMDGSKRVSWTYRRR
jgi:hypothetical protein